MLGRLGLDDERLEHGAGIIADGFEGNRQVGRVNLGFREDDVSGDGEKESGDELAHEDELGEERVDGLLNAFVGDRTHLLEETGEDGVLVSGFQLLVEKTLVDEASDMPGDGTTELGEGLVVFGVKTDCAAWSHLDIFLDGWHIFAFGSYDFDSCFAIHEWSPVWKSVEVERKALNRRK
jgi:hypothetical protein